MNKIIYTFFVGMLLLVAGCKRDKSNDLTMSSNDTYFPVKEYTLPNGLKVFISVNKSAPRIQTAITVKAGSKFDPPQTTGLAHYLEHMLFKGTKKVGTLNYELEKPYLEALENLFEAHLQETDPAKKAAIYKQIDSISYEASKLAIPNEYDKMVSSLGATGTNAFTSRDLTCYINDIPSNALDKWLQLESDRFQNLVLRIFHTELEAVYEEYNINTTYDQEWSSQAVDSLLMPNHPYGSQTTIGLGEQLKNPSMKNIKAYFDKYYVPNNCAIVLSGNLDPEKTIAMIEKHFGAWQKKEVVPFVKQPAVKIAAPLVTEKFGQEPAHVFLGYRFEGADKKDWQYVRMVDMLLANGKGSGLIDLNLKLKQKILNAYSTVSNDKDYTVQKLYGEPKEGQSLDEVKSLLLSQIEEIKKGNFSDADMKAVVDNLKLDLMKSSESNQGRVFDLVFAFVKDIPLEEKKQELAFLSKITKADLVKFANENYKENYAVCYKKMGQSNFSKVEKPQITPIFVNKDTASLYKQQFDKITTEEITPRFCDFEKDIQHATLKNGVKLDYVYNELNKTFKLNYILDMGTDNDKNLSVALNYLPFLGTDKYSAATLKQKFYQLGLTFSVNSSRDQIYVTLEGLEENLEEGVALFEHLLGHVQPDQAVLDQMILNQIKERENSKLDKSKILWEGLRNYAAFGEKNPFNDVYSNEQLKQLKAEELCAILKNITTYQHTIYYYGQKNIDNVVSVLDAKHIVNMPLKALLPATEYPEKIADSASVYFAQYPMKQAEIILLQYDVMFDKNIITPAYLFDEYYGGNMSSVLFQEIREKRALAYSVFGRYTIPNKNDLHHVLLAYVGTQADKLPVAVAEVSHLLNEMPQSAINFDLSKKSFIKQLESDWVTGDAIYWHYKQCQKRGLDTDINKMLYEQAPALQLKDVAAFFDAHVKGKKMKYLILGDKKEIDFAALNQYAKVQELPLSTLFGY